MEYCKFGIHNCSVRRDRRDRLVLRDLSPNCLRFANDTPLAMNYQQTNKKKNVEEQTGLYKWMRRYCAHAKMEKRYVDGSERSSKTSTRERTLWTSVALCSCSRTRKEKGTRRSRSHCENECRKKNKVDPVMLSFLGPQN